MRCRVRSADRARALSTARNSASLSKGFGKNPRPRLHGMNRHRNVGMTGDEHNLLVAQLSGEHLLQIKAIQSRHPDVKDEARRARVRFARKEVSPPKKRPRRNSLPKGAAW